MEYKENVLCYKDYYRLRESVDWVNFSAEQVQRALKNSLYTVTAVENGQTVGMGPAGGRSSIQLIAEKGKEAFYEKMGFKLIPNDFCGAGMRKIIRK